MHSNIIIPEPFICHDSRLSEQPRCGHEIIDRDHNIVTHGHDILSRGQEIINRGHEICETM